MLKVYFVYGVLDGYALCYTNDYKRSYTIVSSITPYLSFSDESICGEVWYYKKIQKQDEILHGVQHWNLIELNWQLT